MSEFHKKTSAEDGRQHKCRECVKTYGKDWWQTRKKTDLNVRKGVLSLKKHVTLAIDDSPEDSETEKQLCEKCETLDITLLGPDCYYAPPRIQKNVHVVKEVAKELCFAYSEEIVNGSKVKVIREENGRIWYIKTSLGGWEKIENG